MPLTSDFLTKAQAPLDVSVSSRRGYLANLKTGATGDSKDTIYDDFEDLNLLSVDTNGTPSITGGVLSYDVTFIETFRNNSDSPLDVEYGYFIYVNDAGTSSPDLIASKPININETVPAREDQGGGSYKVFTKTVTIDFTITLQETTF